MEVIFFLTLLFIVWSILRQPDKLDNECFSCDPGKKDEDGKP